MLRILLVSARPETLGSFTDYFSRQSGVAFQRVGSGADALDRVRAGSPHLVIIDHELPDSSPFKFVPDLLMADAMINTAVVTPMPEEEFHETFEGLGIMARVPLDPTEKDAESLLNTLRNIVGPDIGSDA
jgi:DNA-binding response OmpR family regulator